MEVQDALESHRRRSNMSTRRRLVTGAAAVGLLSSAAIIASQPHTSSPAARSCGVERWSVKTGMDSAAKQVNLTPIKTDIPTLRAIPAPKSPTTRVSPTEFKTYTIRALLTSYTMEADSDYHLVLVDPQARGTLIGEIPSPSCIGKSVFLRQITAARQAFDSKFTVHSGYQDTNTMVTVTGVGFFDKIHGQRGVAPDGIELHPVLSITFK
jgi:hypothetical protein